VVSLAASYRFRCGLSFGPRSFFLAVSQKCNVLGKTDYSYLHWLSTQHNTTQHNTTQYNTTQHNTTQHNTTQHNTTQLNSTQLKPTMINGSIGTLVTSKIS